MPDDADGPSDDEGGPGGGRNGPDTGSNPGGGGSSSGDVGSTPAAGPEGALEVATDEAHRTLDEQLDTLEDIDGKAIQLLQFTVGLLGVVVSVISFTGGNALAAGAGYLAGGMALLVAGAVVAGVTYTVSARVAGVGPNDLSRVATEMDRSATAFREVLIQSYADWIRYNAVANARAALLITVAVLLVVAGALGLALGFVQSLAGPLPDVVTAVAVLGYLVAAYTAGIHRQVGRLRGMEAPAEERGLALPLTEPEMAFVGQVCHKGSVRGRTAQGDTAGDGDTPGG